LLEKTYLNREFVELKILILFFFLRPASGRRLLEPKLHVGFRVKPI